MPKLIQDVRKFINPPYTIKDFFAVLGIAFVFLMVPITVLVSQQNNIINSQAALPPEGGSSYNRYPPCQWNMGPINGVYYKVGYGDVDKDGYVTSKDALMVLNIVAGKYYPVPPVWVIEAADVDDKRPPGKVISSLADVTSVDALQILNFVAYKRNSFDACTMNSSW